MKLFVITIVAVWAVFLVSQMAGAEKIGFVEDFSLARDRAEALRQLIPGTADYYFYGCLHAQQTGDFKRVRELLKAWIKREGYTDKVREIQNRQALLEYEKHPDRSLKHIRETLDLKFDHQREVADEKPDHPTALDPDRIRVETLMERAFTRYKNLQGIEDPGLYAVDPGDLDPDRRRDFLSRLVRPDIPGLAGLVVADLRHKHSGGFGSHFIHRQLLLPQMEECLRMAPELKENSAFINAYLAKLAPGEDVDLRYDPEAEKAYLERLWGYVGDLPPAHNSLKAHVLHAILDWHRRRGTYEAARDRFMTYIALPRNAPYVDPDYLRRREFRHARANLGADFRAATRLPAVGSDEALVRDYLSHFFVEAKSFAPFKKFIRDAYLQDLFVETKILHGLGDMEQWYSLLDPGRYQRLKERVDLDFPPENRRFFDRGEAVSLDLFVKNVETLIVKIFELNTFNYYTAKLAEIDTAVDLDGLVASREEVVRYDLPAFRRVRRTFSFPGIDRPGVYVVEFIGNGRSSRAVIRKGKLFFTEKIGPAGHEFTIYDETNRHRPGATLWMSGRAFAADETGRIIVPFSTRPGPRKVVLREGNLCSLAEFDHQAETYRLDAGFYVDRESLLSRLSATVAVRPELTVNGHPVSTSLLEEVRLAIESVDIHGVSTTLEVPDFAIFEDRESTHEFTVPEDLATVRFSLRAKVRNISRNEKVDLEDGDTFGVNAIDATLKVQDLFLSHQGGDYILEVLGKNGEPKPDRPVRLSFKHRYFREPAAVVLQTDGAGRIRLGPLPGIEEVRAEGPEGAAHTWPLLPDRNRLPANRHGEAGKRVRIPYPAGGFGAGYTLLEKRGDVFVRDHTDAASLEDGYIEIDALPAGDYLLFLRNPEWGIDIRLTQGERKDGFVLSETRVLETVNETPLQISKADVSGSAVTVTLGNATEFARLHVFATRFLPPFDPYTHLDPPPPPEPYRFRPARPESQYVAGRDIGDEHRYILDRKYAEKFPGVMLRRPELLLNPWVVRKTETAVDRAAGGTAYDSKDLAGDIRQDAGRAPGEPVAPATDFSSLDFLAGTSPVLLNLKPDDDGRVTIDRDLLAGRPQVHLVAVDPLNIAHHKLSLAPGTVERRDLRLPGALDAGEHFTEQKKISVIRPGDTFRIGDMTAADFEVYDTLGKVYRLLLTLSGDETLERFGFILGWPGMDSAEKGEKYAEFACHELHFFLFHKDRPFFDAVVRPYLADKKDKTFLDQWLLGGDLSGYLAPWAYNRLNIVEKILLARRGPGDPETARRYVNDRYDLLPPDPETFNRLFDTAVKGRAMEGDLFGFDDAKGRALEEIASDLRREPEAEGIERDLDEEPGEMTRAAMPRSKAMDFEAAEAAPAPPAPSAAQPKMARAKRQFRPERKEQREAARPFFRKLDKTKEWAENNYYHLPIEDQNADLITVNAFWNDYAASDPERPFFSSHFIHAAGNFAEMMLALSVLDLPFAEGEHASRTDGRAFSIDAKSPMVVFHKEIRRAAPAKAPSPILVSQNYFRPDDRYRYEGSERFDKFVTDEFLRGTAYGCQVVIGNPTSARRRLRLLLQIPEGALPLGKGFRSRGLPILLEPYATRTHEYHFYFPRTGRYRHYPVQVAKNEDFVAGADPTVLTAVARLSREETGSWAWVSQNGTPEAVLDFLSTHNLNRIDLSKIAFRMRDRAFFEKVLDLLWSRRVYDQTLWSYGILHNEPGAAGEYLKHSPFADQCGLYIETPLLTLDPVARKDYQHLEYRPLVNARIHPLGEGNKILNDRFHRQYHRFMEYLSYRPDPTSENLAAVTYYLLLQDRVAEALDFFGRIDPEGLEMEIQYDYLQTYLDFHTRNLDRAEATAARYRDYPVPRWRKFFEAAADQLAELKGEAPGVADQEDRDQVQARLAATEPSFDFSVAERRITIRYRNMDRVRINYYPMDIELLFSKNPFVDQAADHFAYIRPNLSVSVDLDGEGAVHEVAVPERFHNSNLMIEILGAGKKRSRAYYANSLDVQVIETYGHIGVVHRETRKPLPMVYVKVYARMKGGGVLFFKDGYTDLRGRFDFVSLSTDELDRVERFALLVLSPEHGAVIREADPPKG